MDNRKPGQTAEAGPLERTLPVGGLFGEFDDTGVGTDLTLEWDSSDPDLHAHMREVVTADELAETRPWIVSTSDEEDRFRHFREAGLPDA